MIKLNCLKKNKAQEVIIQKDDYLDKLTLFNIRKITKDKDITKKEFIESLPDKCIDWEDNQIEKILDIEANINFKLAELDFKFNLDVDLVRTNGQDSFDLPYTRSNTIYLPKNEDKKQKLGHINSHLIVHEVFHIISRKYPQIRNILYYLMGFKLLNKPFDIERFVPSYVINPDALEYNHYIKVLYNKNTYKAFPVIFFKKNKFKWQYLVLLDEEENFIKLVDRSKTTFEYIKYNTGYLSHPEEICAENFRQWIMGSEDLNNPRLLKEFSIRMKDLFN